MLNEQVLPELLRLFGEQFNEDHFARLWWAQDSAPAHKRNDVRDHIMGHGHEREWLPRSPDLTQCDFFLWGYVKSKVYASPPVSVEELRGRIIREITNLKADRIMIRRAVRVRRANV